MWFYNFLKLIFLGWNEKEYKLKQRCYCHNLKHLKHFFFFFFKWYFRVLNRIYPTSCVFWKYTHWKWNFWLALHNPRSHITIITVKFSYFAPQKTWTELRIKKVKLGSRKLKKSTFFTQLHHDCLSRNPRSWFNDLKIYSAGIPENKSSLCWVIKTYKMSAWGIGKAVIIFKVYEIFVFVCLHWRSIFCSLKKNKTPRVLRKGWHGLFFGIMPLKRGDYQRKLDVVPDKIQYEFLPVLVFANKP